MAKRTLSNRILGNLKGTEFDDSARIERFEVPARHVIDAVTLRPPGKPERVYLLLHGYDLSGVRIARRLLPTIPKDRLARSIVLAPNGPYPMVKRTEETDASGQKLTKTHLGFSWYFFNPDSNEYYIDQRVPVSLLRGWLEQLGLLQTPTTILGFSQGGYLAPFLIDALPALDHIVGISARFLDDEFKPSPRVKMDLVIGGADEISRPDEARRAHAAVIARGAQGEYVEVPGAGHKVTPEIAREVTRLLSAH